MFSSKLNSCPSTFLDRSMLEALGGPGERSILSQKRMMGNGDVEEEKHQSLGAEEEGKRENDERPGSHSFESADESSEGKSEKREEEDEEFDEKRANSEEDPEENITNDKKGKQIFRFTQFNAVSLT